MVTEPSKYGSVWLDECKTPTVLLVAIALLTVFLSATASADSRRHRPHAVTLWWVIFNNPEACTTNPGADEQCGPPDVFGSAYLDSVAAGSPDPSLISPNIEAKIGVLYATGGITDSRNAEVRLAASIYRTPGDRPLQLGGDQVIDPLGLATGFVNEDAEVHVVVRDHGRARRDQLVAQRTNFLEPACSDPNLLFEAGSNICVDLQTAVFAAGEVGRDDVIRFADNSTVLRADAYLFRQGDALQVVVDTRIPDRRRRWWRYSQWSRHN